MNYFQYYGQHVIPAGLKSFGYAFRNWVDCMTGNYEDYVSSDTQDPEEECCYWFWVALGEDTVLPKKFLDSFYDLVARVERGDVRLIPFDELDTLLEESTDA
jgi:hypothetical protein